uniref:Uncharacterized protein n=1 Tax=Manihot esculenta TaxID=3983 RepID=A0A199UBM7_MANES
MIAQLIWYKEEGLACGFYLVYSGCHQFFWQSHHLVLKDFTLLELFPWLC